MSDKKIEENEYAYTTQNSYVTFDTEYKTDAGESAKISWKAENVTPECKVDWDKIGGILKNSFSAEKSYFAEFLDSVVATQFETAMTANGSRTIKQTARNQLRKAGVEALKKDLEKLLPDYDVVETKDGLIIVAENSDFTFSWELKSTIKSLDFDPFIEASNYDDATAAMKAKKEAREKEKIEKQKLLEEKRAAKLEQIEAKKRKAMSKGQD